MFDPVSLATGAGLLTAGWIIGRISRRRPKDAYRTEKCGCGHGPNMHENLTSACQQYVGPSTILPLDLGHDTPALPPHLDNDA